MLDLVHLDHNQLLLLTREQRDQREPRKEEQPIQPVHQERQTTTHQQDDALDIPTFLRNRQRRN